jgi:hypothetical protein
MEQEPKPVEPVKKGKWGKTVKVSLGVLGGLSLLMGYISATGMPQPEGEGAARKILDDFIAALNAGDREAAGNALHYPHIQIEGKQTLIWNSAEDFRLELDSVAAAEGWHHSTLDSCIVRQNGADKMHFEVHFSLFSAEGVRCAAYQSFWIVTKIGGRWGIQCRSSLTL